MQTRPYPEKNGLRIWLARSEQRVFLEAVDDEPRRRIALQLGLHGLRTDEILQVEPRHFRELANGADGYVLTVPDGKIGKRETPISDDLVERVRYCDERSRPCERSEELAPSVRWPIERFEQARASGTTAVQNPMLLEVEGTDVVD